MESVKAVISVASNGATVVKNVPIPPAGLLADPDCFHSATPVKVSSHPLMQSGTQPMVKRGIISKSKSSMPKSGLAE